MALALAPPPPPPSDPSSFQLLEINIISAQELAPLTRSMRTYAVAWIQADRKLCTRIARDGHTDPTWNDKFIFRVNEAFLRNETSAVMIQIYATRCLKDTLVGTVRVLVGNILVPGKGFGFSGMKFTALQIWRPSGRPQGILNLGVTVLDGSMRSMPLYRNANTALGYRDLMGETAFPQPLRRSKSEYNIEDESDTKFPAARKALSRSETLDSDSVSHGVGKASLWSDSADNASTSTGIPSHARLPLPPSHEEYFPAEVGSSILEDWSVASSAGKEQLRLKLERWKADFPPLYDPGYGSFRQTVSQKGEADGSRGGCFSCFGEKFSAGCECSIFIGLNSKKKGRDTKVHLSPSDANISEPFKIA